MPFNLLNQWLIEEKDAGAPNPQHAVLATSTLNALPHSRVIAIREIRSTDLIFFTQKGTRKVCELQENPQLSLTFWFELNQREVIIEGFAEPLTDLENENYWHAYPHSAQLRFAAYAPTSMQPILSKQEIEASKEAIEQKYLNQKLPLNPFYCGFRIIPQRFVFYAYRLDELSDVCEYQWQNKVWSKQLLSP
ncbi:MAG: pyridoxamine 5'-phosphate oxidase family protein [Tatlockia sp.]|nr:pyridoxamine 5'-phosphate oxidase family protein [Tatlockia sp.]